MLRSLVGSEMCIRDSPGAHAGAHTRCQLNISMEVRFSKSTFLQSKITSNTLSRESERWKEWCTFATDFIEKKKGLRRSSKIVQGAKKNKTGMSSEMNSGSEWRQQQLAGVLVLLVLVLVLMVLVETKMRSIESQLATS
eukprot:TRINITY_DN1153_c0_g1_i1.p1 TRINITY_DN1153_c0_g1~~TRINITY_DN1153_c0_g1_i1.p1  ORF type:complete len:158 (+),score=62.75 TRINITY_DN1153_c0_g1_i1:59-475(+)